jgi:hypothetical protein
LLEHKPRVEAGQGKDKGREKRKEREVQGARKGRGRLALSTGEKYLTAADSQDGREPETGFEYSPLVRGERAYPMTGA